MNCGVRSRVLAVVLATVAQSACGVPPSPDGAASDAGADTAALAGTAAGAGNVDPAGVDTVPRPGADFDGDDPVSAADPWEAAWLAGVVFRAVGQEPGWLLEVNGENRLRFLGDYGEISFRPRAPAEVAIDTATHAVTWTSRTEGHDLVATVREAPCTDIMSGEAFTHVVEVRLDERVLNGCGRRAG